MLKSEIRRAIVTDGVVERREGLELPSDLVDAAGLCDGERVLVVSETTGRRLETFVQAGDPRTGRVVVCGGAAHEIRRGERLTVLAFGYSHEPVLPQRVALNERNEVVS